jgi:hypothetical protein
MSDAGPVVRVPMEVTWRGAWLSWVGAVTTCLNALGKECDQTDVAGYSGYAFHLCVHEELCPSGPTVLDWYSLAYGPHHLGRTGRMFFQGECHDRAEGHGNERTEAACRYIFEEARREVEAGRPSVLWGAYVPEFAAVVGIEGDRYLVKSYRDVTGEEAPPVPWHDLEAPGGPTLLTFPTEVEIPRHESDRFAAGAAVRTFRGYPRGAKYGWGKDAYRLWIRALTEGVAMSFGNAYCAACYAEGRGFARDFLARLAGRNPRAEDYLRAASERYAAAAEALQRVVELFPFPGKGAVREADEARNAEAVEALFAALAAEDAAQERLVAACGLDWSPED